MDKITEYKADVASSLQKILEETYLKLTKTVKKIRDRYLNSDYNTIGFSGGVALSCPNNSRIYNSGIFDSVLIPPFVDDSGLALGSAQYLHYHILDRKRSIENTKKIDKNIPYLGASYNREKVLECIEEKGFLYR